MNFEQEIARLNSLGITHAVVWVGGKEELAEFVNLGAGVYRGTLAECEKIAKQVKDFGPVITPID